MPGSQVLRSMSIFISNRYSSQLLHLFLKKNFLRKSIRRKSNSAIYGGYPSCTFLLITQHNFEKHGQKNRIFRKFQQPICSIPKKLKKYVIRLGN